MFTRCERANISDAAGAFDRAVFAAGTGPDIVARLTGEWLSERLGQQFVVEDRQGGASNIAVEAVVRAPADGYTLLQVTSANAINATL